MPKNMLVQGVGVNDLGYSTHIVDGKRVTLKSYTKWTNILIRCYSGWYAQEHPTYVDCKVCAEWHYYSAFKDWMDNQSYDGNMDLDKDFLVEGNKIYSPDTCILIPQEINKFLTIRTNDRGANPLGVTRATRWSKKYYRAQCNNYEGKRCAIGSYYSEMEAHMAYLKFKLEALELHMLNYTNEPLITKGLTRIRDKILFHIENNLELKSF